MKNDESVLLSYFYTFLFILFKTTLTNKHYEFIFFNIKTTLNCRIPLHSIVELYSSILFVEYFSQFFQNISKNLWNTKKHDQIFFKHIWNECVLCIPLLYVQIPLLLKKRESTQFI